MNPDVKKERQVIMLRGIAAQIQAMHTPTWENLKSILSKFGWKLTRDDSKPTNNHESN